MDRKRSIMKESGPQLKLVMNTPKRLGFSRMNSAACRIPWPEAQYIVSMVDPPFSAMGRKS
jgi:hypothetical protein